MEVNFCMEVGPRNFLVDVPSGSTLAEIPRLYSAGRARKQHQASCRYSVTSFARTVAFISVLGDCCQNCDSIRLIIILCMLSCHDVRVLLKPSLVPYFCYCLLPQLLNWVALLTYIQTVLEFPARYDNLLRNRIEE